MLRTTMKIGALAGVAYFGHAVYTGLTLRPRTQLRSDLQSLASTPPAQNERVARTSKQEASK